MKIFVYLVLYVYAGLRVGKAASKPGQSIRVLWVM
jgi:hypothetical protein